MSYLLSFVSGQPFNSPTYTLPQWRMNFYSWFSGFQGFAGSVLQVFVTEQAFGSETQRTANLIPFDARLFLLYTI